MKNGVLREVAIELIKQIDDIAKKYDCVNEMNEAWAHEIEIQGASRADCDNDELIYEALCYHLAFLDRFDPEMLEDENLSERFESLFSFAP